MTQTRVWAALLLMAAVVGIALPTTAMAAPPPPPPPGPNGAKASIERLEWAVDEKMNVAGDGWTPGTVNVQICGNVGLNGSPDCDQPSSRSFGVGSTGIFFGRMVVAGPPAPCPCVVIVRSTTGDQVVSIPIVITGHPIETTTTQVEPDLGLTTIDVTTKVSGGTAFRDVVGFSPKRAIAVTITNTGDFPTGDGTIDLASGKDSPPTGFAGTAPFKSIVPGDTTTVVMEFSLDAFAQGTYTIEGKVVAPRATGTFATSTSAFPWFLLAALVLLILLIDLVLVLRTRRKRKRRLLAAALALAAANAPELPDCLTCIIEFEHEPQPVDAGLMAATTAQIISQNGRFLAVVQGSKYIKLLIAGVLEQPDPSIAGPTPADSDSESAPEAEASTESLVEPVIEPSAAEPADEAVAEAVVQPVMLVAPREVPAEPLPELPPPNRVEVVSILAAAETPVRIAIDACTALEEWLQSEFGLDQRSTDPAGYFTSLSEFGPLGPDGQPLANTAVPLNVRSRRPPEQGSDPTAPGA